MRDIASDYSAGFDSIVETRDRLKDLLNGYGQGIAPHIGVPLEGVVAGLTQGNINRATNSLEDLDSACSAWGF